MRDYDWRMRNDSIIALLGGGDRRSIGKAERVAAMVGKDRRLFAGLMKGLWSDDALVRMRAADAAEKVTRERPEWLKPYKKELLGLLAETEQQELRWHLAAMVPRLALNTSERRAAMETLQKYLQDRSSIVRTFALQGLTDLAGEDTALRGAVIEILRKATRSGTAAMKARGRKLLAGLERG